MDATRFETLLRASLDLWRVEADLRFPGTVAGPGPSGARAGRSSEALPGGPTGAPAEAPAEGACGQPLQARLVLADGGVLRVVEAGPQDEPFRWWLQWHAGTGDAAGGEGALLRRKPCASTLGLLRSLREALGVAAVAKVRIGTGAGASEGVA